MKEYTSVFDTVTLDSMRFSVKRLCLSGEGATGGANVTMHYLIVIL